MTRLRPEPRHLPLAFAVFAIAVHAQQGEGGGAGGGGSIQPRLGFSQSWTDNLRLSEHDKDAALITTVSPGISIVRNSGAVRASLDYSLNGIAYLKTNQASQIQNALAATARAEIIPGTLSIDAQASIGQQSTSAFGLQSTPTLGSQGAVSTLSNQNQHETGRLSVSPALGGQLGGIANFNLRGDFSITEVRGSGIGDGRSSGGTLSISQLSPGVLSWFLQAGIRQSRFSGAPSNRNESLTAGLNYRPDPDWAFSANVGQERSDYLTTGGEGNSQSGVTGGATASWAPTPRTSVSSNWQRHRYGNSHGLNFSHRMQNSVWQLSDNRSVMLGNTGSSGGVRTNYDLYYLLLASVEPDPVKRDQLVRTSLLAIGLSPDAPLSTGFLSTGPSQLRNQMFSFALQGVRSSVTAQVSRSITSRLGSGANQGDLATNSRIEQRSYSLSGSYQLSPVSGFSLTVSRQSSLGDSVGASTRLNSVLANWTGRLGQRVSVQLGVRHSRFEGVTLYSENGAFANVTQRF